MRHLYFLLKCFFKLHSNQLGGIISLDTFLEKKQKSLRKEILSDYVLFFSGLCNGYRCSLGLIICQITIYIGF